MDSLILLESERGQWTNCQYSADVFDREKDESKVKDKDKQPSMNETLEQ